MSFWNRLNASAAPKDREELVDALQQASNHQILPHLRQLNQESDPERSLQLMAPSHFGEMARQSCRANADVVIRTTQDIARRAERGNARRVTRDETVTALASCLADFGRKLENYSREYERFTRLLAEAKGGFLERSFHAGYRGAALGDSLFGPLGAVAGAMLNGFITGKATEKAIDAAGEQLDQAFRQMLGAWDKAMAAMTGEAIQLVGVYIDHVLAGAD